MNVYSAGGEIIGALVGVVIGTIVVSSIALAWIAIIILVCVHFVRKLRTAGESIAGILTFILQPSCSIYI